MPRLYPLFVYGTLKDEEIQALLFNSKPPSKTAILKNYAVYVDPNNGYFFAKKELGGFINGKVLFLTKQELAKADEWEEVPIYYYRKLTKAEVEGKSLFCWIYLKDSESYIKASFQEIARVPKEKIISEIFEMKNLAKLGK